MPSLSEFRLSMRPIESVFSDCVDVVFHFTSKTVFRSFRYVVDLEVKRDTEQGTIHFDLKGVRTDSGMMSETGPASSEIVVEDVDHQCHVIVTGSGDRERTEFDMVVRDGEVAVENVSGSAELIVDASDTTPNHAS